MDNVKPPTIQEVSTFLQGLGATPEDVARNLNVAGIQGTRMDPCDCAVQQALQAAFGPVNFSVHINCGRQEAEWSEWSDDHWDTHWDTLTAVFPPAVSDFAFEFDAGEHPGLVRDLEEDPEDR